MIQLALHLDGHDSGPLFAPPVKRRPPVRPRGKAGVVHRRQTVRATPAWADRRAIREFYAEARRLTAATGELHVVDHIVPKIGGGSHPSQWVVCGLHVPANLRVIHWRENTAKANLWWPDMWGDQCSLL